MHQQLTTLTGGLQLGPDAIRRHRELREAAAADRELVAYICAAPEAGGRARLAAVRDFIRRSGVCTAGLTVRYKHADAIWQRVLAEARHG